MGFNGMMFQTTNPWNDRQFIKVDGRPFVYHGDASAITVEFPGGKSRRVSELREQGRIVTLPDNFRQEVPGIHKNVAERRAPHQSKTKNGFVIPKL